MRPRQVSTNIFFCLITNVIPFWDREFLMEHTLRFPCLYSNVYFARKGFTKKWVAVMGIFLFHLKLIAFLIFYLYQLKNVFCFPIATTNFPPAVKFSLFFCMSAKKKKSLGS